MATAMRPDDDVCYRAVSSRDARFDGWFYVGVTSTGIYCRPSCPAMTPRRANVTFHSSAAAAQAAGFRACKRCRPDATPGSPAWNVRGDVAGRALRMITDGAVDRGGVQGLAQQLGYSARQINRTLIAQVGAGPLALARAQRAQTARILLETTALPVTDVAFAAGFGSVRQYNDTIREVFATTPGDLRRRAGGDAADQAESPAPDEVRLALRLPFRPPMALRDTLAFLRAHGVRGLEQSTPEGGYARVVQCPHAVALIDVSPTLDRAAGARATDRVAPAVRCAVTLHDVRDLAFVVARVRALLDLDADPVAVDEALSGDPVLREAVAARPGLRSPGAIDGFEVAARTVVGQQVSVAGARTVTARIVQALGEQVAFGEQTWRTFPTPSAIVAADPAMLPLPQARIRTLKALAHACLTGLSLDPGADRAATRAELLELPGIGPWTADYVLMRALGDPDVLLDTDLIIRRALAQGGHNPGAWSPWRSYANHHLWFAAKAAQWAGARATANPDRQES